MGHPRSVDGIAICGGVCGVEVEQWWSTMVVRASVAKLEAWCSGGGASLNPGSGSDGLLTRQG